MGAVGRAEMHAGAVVGAGKSALAKVAVHQLRHKVQPAAALPAHQVFGGHEDPAVAGLSAAHATGEAIEGWGVTHVANMRRRKRAAKRSIRADARRWSHPT